MSHRGRLVVTTDNDVTDFLPRHVAFGAGPEASSKQSNSLQTTLNYYRSNAVKTFHAPSPVRLRLTRRTLSHLIVQ